jgi:hypothetical protein
MKKSMKKRLGRKGEILIGDIVFILINCLFLVLLILFLLKQGSGVIVLEQLYAKEIALSIDYVQPVMLIKLDMEKGMKLAKKNGIGFNEVVKIDGNVVRVKLSDSSGYTYSFFNDVEVGAYPDRDGTSHYTGLYVITVGEKSK